MFPFIACELTGLERPGYAVCHHVLHGAEIAEVYPATEDQMGYVSCMLCRGRQDQNQEDQNEDELTARDFELVCADCCEMGMLSGQKVGRA
jgi:hypothetical protein